MKNLTKAFTIVLVLIFLEGIVLIFLEELLQGNVLKQAHIIVKRYSLPDLVFRNGETQLIMILLKGSSKAGIGCDPASGMT